MTADIAAGDVFDLLRWGSRHEKPSRPAGASASKDCSKNAQSAGDVPEVKSYITDSHKQCLMCLTSGLADGLYKLKPPPVDPLDKRHTTIHH